MDAQALEDTYRRYFPVIRAKASRMLQDNDEAQDVAQETFSRLWAKRETLRDPEARLGWIYRTATRLAIDRLRKRASVSNEELREPASRRDEWSAQESKGELAMLARHLPRKELMVLLLSRVDGMRQDEVGAVMQISDRTVRRLLDSGSRRLERVRASQEVRP